MTKVRCEFCGRLINIPKAKATKMRKVSKQIKEMGLGRTKNICTQCRKGM